jgi:hypothetical protein
MIKALIILLQFFISSAWALEYRSPMTVVPEEVGKIFGKSEKEVIALFGEPQLRKDEQLYYEIESYRYRLIINLGEGKVQQVRYVVSSGPALTEFASAKGEGLTNLSPYPAHGHSQGRYLRGEISNEDGKWELYFHNNTQRQLQSFVWKMP